MSYEKQGTGYDPGAAGYELQGRAKGPQATPPEWAEKEARKLIRTIYPVVDEDGRAYIPADEIPTIALALSAAYERGQVNMRERAAATGEHLIRERRGLSLSFDMIATSIRSLPIDGKDA